MTGPTLSGRGLPLEFPDFHRQSIRLYTRSGGGLIIPASPQLNSKLASPLRLERRKAEPESAVLPFTPWRSVARLMGLEPTTFGETVRRSSQLSYSPIWLLG